jgi:hypothetical protein
MYSTAALLGLGLVSCSMPVIRDIPTYEDFVVGLCADDVPDEVSDIFGSWRYDCDWDGLSLELEQHWRMELASPPESILATPVFEGFVTALSGTLVMDPSADVFNPLESSHAFGEYTDFFCDTPCPMGTLLDISDIADVAPPIVSGLGHVKTRAAASERRNPVGLMLEADDWSNSVVQQVSLVRGNAIRRPHCVTDRKLGLVRRNAIKRFARNF